jgi:hypothetical protein
MKAYMEKKNKFAAKQANVGVKLQQLRTARSTF